MEQTEKKKREKPLRPKYNMWQNAGYMVRLAWRVQEKKVLFVSLAIALLTVALNLIQLYVVPVILLAVERHVPVGELALVIGAFVGGLMLVSAAKRYAEENVMFGRITVRCKIINMINQKAATTSYPNLGDDKFEKLRSKAWESTCANSSASEAVWTTLTDLVGSAVGFAVYLFLFSNVQPLLMLAVIATTAVSYFVSLRLNDYRYRHREEEADCERRMEYFSRRASRLESAKDIRIFGLRPWLEELNDKAIGAYVAFHERAAGVCLWGKIVDLVLTFVRNGAAYALLISLVLDGTLDVAGFVLFFTAVGGFTEWVTGILGGLNKLHRQSLDLCAMRECLEFPEPFLFEEGKPVRAGEGAEIVLSNVSFRYPNAEKDVLHGIDLTLHRGEKLAIVGLNGAGKTTLVKLMCGFLDPTEGKVLFNGEDVRTLNRREYYGQFSAVFQQFSLLAGSVAANVAQSEEAIDMARVVSCVGKAGLKEKIESLPEGYETKLNREVYEDAVMLSGGETQRLMLARALYKDAPCILLDEPTAALDPIAEADVYAKYHEMTKDRSSVYISHRLASTRFCDRIVLIADGKIAEEGTHEKLMKRGGRYAQLFEVQSKYYREGGEDETN